ncbi:MAG: FMN-binding negative transcriptional regulator [Polyangiaceae bacterium]|nr:FMN-binding negative transcriptional regulator [Polyangiaceae bacterium]
MYVPAHFAEADPAAARALIDENPFGLLVVPLGDGVELAHLPFVLAPQPLPHGVLYAHVAKQNPLATLLAHPRRVIAVFTGPHAYISPRWYAAPSKSVPTWNYMVTHAHGVATPIEGRDAVLRVLADLTDRFEAGVAEPWSIASADPTYLETMWTGVVAFAIAIERFETKMKLSQNRSAEDRLRVASALRAHGGAGDEEIAREIEERTMRSAGSGRGGKAGNRE